MSERELFEQSFPVPAGIYWNEISEQYDALPGAAGFDDVEIYHGRWEAWQVARLGNVGSTELFGQLGCQVRALVEAGDDESFRQLLELQERVVAYGSELPFPDE